MILRIGLLLLLLYNSFANHINLSAQIIRNSNLQIGIGTSGILPAKTVSSQPWLSQSNLRKHGIPTGCNLIYTQGVSYPYIKLAIDKKITNKLWIETGATYSKYNISVGRIGYDTSDSPAQTMASNLPIWTALSFKQIQFELLSKYSFSKSNLGISFSAGLTINFLYPQTVKSFPFNVTTDTSFNYRPETVHAINFNLSKIDIQPKLIINTWANLGPNDKISLEFGAITQNLTKSLNPVLVEFWQGEFHSTKLSLPKSLLISVGVTYYYSILRNL